MTGGLQVLALTDALRDGEFERFRHMSSSFLDQYSKDGVVLVADRDGRPLFSSINQETPIPSARNNREMVDKVFSTRKAQY